VMASRQLPPHLLVSAATAAQASLADGAVAELTYDSAHVKLPVKVIAGFADGCVGVPAGIAGVPLVEAGASVALVPEKRR